MATNEADRQESEIPKLVVKALTAAHYRAVQAGHPLVLVKNGALVRLEASKTTLLKQLPARKKVTIRTKTARS